ncbi:conserved unknown protein [Ectocarpus siliculosus]|uniref:JmjC domain-containing protein n=1 Tax=Ectocarpus siliculosus TaxID=2880 RepID=D7FPG4_ECTSI|nr:conserved unknown protein [Ectocarpus siliculosus]|eukprot:CBJ30422.1 conserved unknown protein [Ectocarpus siliculosus]
MAKQVRRLDASTAEYSDFVYVMKNNTPKDGRADVDFLRQEFGDMEVPVVECSPLEGYGEERRVSMTLREYLDAVHDGERPEPTGGSSSDSGGGPVLYLKDWHFQRLVREGKKPSLSGSTSADGGGASAAGAMETPSFFRDDWLNWWCDRQGQDDYRFVYIGPPGSFTGLHHDVLNSFSWSFNVCGSKHWTLFPTEATPDLYDRYGRDLAKDVRSGRADPDKFPRLDAAPRLEVYQGPGEAIFVPSGWHHQVVNTGDGREGGGGLTVSVNTNWFNGFNLDKVAAFLHSELSAVRAALDHLRETMSGGGGAGGTGGRREWENQCELVMRANSSFNVTDFARLVTARAQHLLGARAAQDSLCDDDPERCRGSGASGRGSSSGSGAWQQERWVVLALQQLRAVLRELLVAPSADHVFLDDGGDSASLPDEDGATSGEGGDIEGGSDRGLRETLDAVETYLLTRDVTREQSSGASTTLERDGGGPVD